MIYGKRIRFRSIEKDDLEAFKNWMNDPEVRAGLSLYAPLSSFEEEQWFESVMQRPKDERPFGIEVRDGAGWKLVGNLAFFDIHWRTRSAEFGIFIGDKAYWNQGYGTEAVRLLVRHGFETLNLNRVYLRVFEDNPRARRAYEKAGFTLEGRQRQAEFRQGRYWDVLMMSILRAEWQPEPPPGDEAR